MGAFKAYDIRGVYNKDFNKEDVYRIGFYLPKLLNTTEVLVGRDDRVSSPEIFEYLSKGITDSGANLYDVGLATTPMIYYMTAKHDFDASVMITASHNPKEHNGLKISRTNALPVGFDTGLNELEKLIKNDQIEVALQKGEIIKLNVKEEYTVFLKQFCKICSSPHSIPKWTNGAGQKRNRISWHTASTGTVNYSRNRTKPSNSLKTFPSSTGGFLSVSIKTWVKVQSPDMFVSMVSPAVKIASQ